MDSGRVESKKRGEASRVRQEIMQTYEKIGADLERMIRYRSMLRGSLYQWRRKCGQEGCHCARGKLHVSWVLSYREAGRAVKVHVSAGRLKECRTLGEAYREFRRARARVMKGQARIGQLLNELEMAVCVEPPKPKEREG